jgi:large repetitive protein
VTLLGALAIAAGFAFAASSPPAPTITSHPATPTTSTSGAFSFADTQSGVTFQCSLDGAAYSACSSPKSYSGLAAGSHTFAVRATDTHGKTSGTTSFTWTIDLAPPSTTVIFPGRGGLYTTTSWNDGCFSTACGSAFDPSGVSAVAVSIRQDSTGRYWTGTGYSASNEQYRGAALVPLTSTTVMWFYALPTPSPDGQYTIHVRSTDKLGNVTPSGSPIASSFAIDTTPPPAPRITSLPANPSTSTSAQFAFSDAESPVKFQCQLDAAAFAACTSPSSHRNLSTGSHTFSVRATDAAGNTSAAARYSWTISASSGMPFTIAGVVPNPLYPGAAAQPIPLRVTNPNSVTIYVTSLTATVQSTGANGCTTSWFQVAAANLPSAGISIPANGSITVPTASDPTLQMIESHTNQDACKSATLTLTYSGSAHS